MIFVFIAIFLEIFVFSHRVFFFVFSLVMASRGFVAVTVIYCCQKRSEMWSNGKNQKLQMFSVVFTSFDSFIYECSICSRELWSTTDLRFNLEIFVFTALIFVSSMSSEIPIQRLIYASQRLIYAIQRLIHASLHNRLLKLKIPSSQARIALNKTSSSDRENERNDMLCQLMLTNPLNSSGVNLSKATWSGVSSRGNYLCLMVANSSCHFSPASLTSHRLKPCRLDPCTS